VKTVKKVSVPERDYLGIESAARVPEVVMVMFQETHPIDDPVGHIT
jgi:hypothetical protein